MVTAKPRLGFHYYPDDRHYTQADLVAWLPHLESLGARWLTLRADIRRAIPETFLRGLKEAGIEPIIHIPCPIGAADATALSALFSSYASWDIRHVVLFDRPNLKTSWEYPAWARRGLVERFLDCLLPILETARGVGLLPIFPPLDPGGDYWDTAFLEASLVSIIRRGHRSLVRDLILATYAWAYDRPLDWGAGGPRRWPEAQPYSTPTASQDHRGLHIFDWYADISERIAGIALPMIVVAGGSLPTKQAAAASNLQGHAERNLAIARMFEGEEVSPLVRNIAFYLLSCDPTHDDHCAAWFPSDAEPLPIVSMMQKHSSSLKSEPPRASPKRLEHYVLLPQAFSAGLQDQWSALTTLAAEPHAAFGFSLQDAISARTVTLVGDQKAIPDEVENQLLAAGCSVRRLPHAQGEVVAVRAQDESASPVLSSSVPTSGAAND